MSRKIKIWLGIFEENFQSVLETYQDHSKWVENIWQILCSSNMKANMPF